MPPAIDDRRSHEMPKQRDRIVMVTRQRCCRPKMRALGLALLLGLAGCASIQQPHRDHLDSANARIRECARWYAELESAVNRSGVTDIASRRVSGFPYLRVDRFVAGFGAAAGRDSGVREAWITRMRALDADGRHVEIDNLPAEEVEKFETPDRAALVARARDCALRLAAADLLDDANNALLERRARVGDDYSSLKRALGLYELTRLPFHMGVRNWQEDVTRRFQAARGGEPARGPRVLYRPPAIRGYTRQEVGEILALAARHPLGLPQLSEQQRDRLFATYAPLLEIETTGPFDRIGKLFWSRSASPGVDISHPTVYRRLDYTRMNDRTLLQLVYVVWMPERPHDNVFDLLAGHLDGVAWRVTLAPDGEPVLFDSIHPCGCYHMFFPTPRVERIEPERRDQEWAFTPASLPEIPQASRLVVSLQTRTHYIGNVWPDEAAEGTEYRFADYDELRRLPLPGGGSRSIFGPDGLVPGTERGERFLFWPMGIASAGAMRQAGSQATAFVGRRHFDDADLIERRFRLRY